jgi:hypothetical protein
MHVDSFPKLVNPFFVYNYHTIPPLHSRTKVTHVRTFSINAHIASLFWACSVLNPHFADGVFKLSRITRPTPTVPSTVSQDFHFATIYVVLVCELYHKELHLEPPPLWYDTLCKHH